MGTNSTIRGHKAAFKVYRNGVQTVIDTITDVSINQDSTFIRSKFVGNPIPLGDQTQEGFSGSINMEVKNDTIERFIDALITENLNGIGISDCIFIDTEMYADGTMASYVYFDAQFKLSKKSPNHDKLTKTLDMQASGRMRI